MDDAAEHFWAHETVLGTRGQGFWWRLDAAGDLTVRRTESRQGRRSVHDRTVSRDQLERLAAFMADGAWHRLAAGAKALRAGPPPDSIGPFFHREFGWSPQSTRLASPLAVVLTHAGLWQWNQQRIGMEFRQPPAAAALVEKLRAHFQQRQADPAATDPPAPRKHDERLPGQIPPQFGLAEKFLALTKSLWAQLQECDAGGRHHLEKGQRRESAVRDLLRAQLPPCYAVTRGEVISPTGEASRQMDILIHDALHAPALLESEGARLLAVESVYAAIEVKPRLTLTELRAAVENIRSVKALSAGVAALRPDHEDAPIAYGAIFSFHAVDPRIIARELKTLQQGISPALCVDCVCVLDHFVIHRRGPTLGLPAVHSALRPPRGRNRKSQIANGKSPSATPLPPSPFRLPPSEPLSLVAAGPHSLLLFYLLLLEDLNAKTLRPPNLFHYAQGMDLPEPELF